MIYLDHAATCPIRKSVWDVMARLVGEADFNPASLHSPGGRAAAALEQARRDIAAALGTARSDILFTGGGTQSDNLAILGFARATGGTARLLVPRPRAHCSKCFPWIPPDGWTRRRWRSGSQVLRTAPRWYR
jgi:cysteine desulfurase